MDEGGKECSRSRRSRRASWHHSQEQPANVEEYRPGFPELEKGNFGSRKSRLANSVDPTILWVSWSAIRHCYQRLPKDQCSLIPVSQYIPSGDLQMVARSGHLEFHRDAEKSQMDEIFRPHDFLQITSRLARSREGTKRWRAQSHLRFLPGYPVDFLLWAVTFRCQSNRQVEWRMERGVLC